MLMHLIHSCTVERPTSAADALGNKRRTFAAHLSNIACRLVRKTQTGRDSISGAYMVSNNDLLLVSANADINVGDRITNIVYEDGTAEALRFEVRSSITRRGVGQRHRSLALEQVT